MKFLALTFALFAASVGAMQEKTRGGLLLADNAARSFTIRLCNAYAYHLPLDVKKGDVSVLSSPIAYRECRDVSAQEDTGDKLDFYVQSTPPVKAGTFAVSDLPTENKRSILLLVVHRADAGSTAMAFQSHVFAPLKNSQIAVLDGYKGDAEGIQLRIEDHPEAGKVKAGVARVRSEDLKYNSVVAVNPGHYTVRLTMSAGHKLVDMKELVALNKESYVLLRVGLHPSTEGAVSYPEELIVFPNTDRNALSAAGRGVASVVSVAALLVSLVFAWL